MSNFGTLAAVAFTSSQGTFGTTVSYARPGDARLDAIAAFDLNCIVNTTGNFESPTGPLWGEVMLKIADINGGPQKGDEITFGTRVYRVQELFSDPEVGMARVQVRFLRDA